MQGMWKRTQKFIRIIVANGKLQSRENYKDGVAVE